MKFFALPSQLKLFGDAFRSASPASGRGLGMVYDFDNGRVKARET
jgi:hypothetical protein